MEVLYIYICPWDFQVVVGDVGANEFFVFGQENTV